MSKFGQTQRAIYGQIHVALTTAFENVGGKLIKRHVNESDHVKKGQLLLELDQDDLLSKKRRKTPGFSPGI